MISSIERKETGKSKWKLLQNIITKKSPSSTHSPQLQHWNIFNTIVDSKEEDQGVLETRKYTLKILDGDDLPITISVRFVWLNIVFVYLLSFLSSFSLFYYILKISNL